VNLHRFALPYGYYTEVLWELATAEFKSRYRRRSLSLLWWFIEPALLAVTFFFLTLVLAGGGAVRASSFAEIFMRVVFWQWFRNSVNIGMTAMVSSAGIVKQIAFPPTLLLTSRLLIEFINCLISIALVAIVLTLAGVPLSVTWLQLPIPVLLQFALTAALCFWLATVAVFLQDTIPIVNFGLNLLMYLSPVAYRPEIVPAALQRWMSVNPFATLMGLYNAILIDGAWITHWLEVARWSAVAALVGASGYYVFERSRTRFYRFL
jgi:ABC-type polysaccharide/polyol phosphate export permease